MDGSSLDMDPNIARALLVQGATLIVHGLPEGSEFGIDLNSWNTGPKFKGLKMIPPGIHIFYYNVSNKYGDVAPRTSFIYHFKKSEIMVKKWNSDLEELCTEDVSEEELSRLKSNIYNLDEFLGPYPYHVYDMWKSLIRNVSDKVVERVTPECGVIRSALDLVSDVSCLPSVSSNKLHPPSNCDIDSDSTSKKQTQKLTQSSVQPENGGESSKLSLGSDLVKCDNRRRRRKDLEESLLPPLKPTPGTALRFTQVPEDLFPEGSTPADITSHSIDPTFTLETLLASLDNENEYIGEIELSFVCFLAGLSLDALESWKKLIRLVCRCEKAVVKRPKFYIILLTAINNQLRHIPEDFLVDIVESENAIYMSLRDVFRSTLTSDHIDPQLRKTVLDLSQKLSEKFEWDFSNLEEEDDEDAPVIVDLGN